MSEKSKNKSPFGKFLRGLREKKGVTLKDVEVGTGITNAYISQLETGARKRLPAPDKLKKLATYFNVTLKELLEKAGYAEPDQETKTTEQKINEAFAEVTSDSRFQYGTRVKGEYDLDAKRFIVEMYEKVTSRKLL